MNERTFVAALALLCVPVLGASRASAQAAEDRDLRLGAHLALGFGGDADVFSDPGVTSSAALDPTVGFALRAELPVLDFVAIGGLFEALTFQADSDTFGRDRTRKWAFDFDAFARVRYVIELPDAGLFLEPYLLLPLGFSFGMLHDLDGDGDEAWPGWNTGVLAGLSVLTASGLGGFLELGWRHHEVYTQWTVPFIGSNVDVSLVTNQFALNLGFVAVL